MAVTINGDTGITSVNGTAAAPSITGADTDTGIVYGTNTLSLATGGTTALTINSSQTATFTGAATVVNGSLGVGTASPSAPVTVGRVNSAEEGGQIDLCRASDNASSWGIDVFGSTSTPSLRFVDNVASATRAAIDGSGNFSFNSGYGSAATVYGCRAWVNFRGTGTVTIRSSGNVSSVSDDSVANYTVNFSIAMPDANYAFPFGGEGNTAASNLGYPTCNPVAANTYGPTASLIKIRCANGANGAVDLEAITVAIFR